MDGRLSSPRLTRARTSIWGMSAPGSLKPWNPAESLEVLRRIDAHVHSDDYLVAASAVALRASLAALDTHKRLSEAQAQVSARIAESSGQSQSRPAPTGGH